MQTFRQIAEFELGDVLGVGTVGTIYRATEKVISETIRDQKTASGSFSGSVDSCSLPPRNGDSGTLEPSAHRPLLRWW